MEVITQAADQRGHIRAADGAKTGRLEVPVDKHVDRMDARGDTRRLNGLERPMIIRINGRAACRKCQGQCRDQEDSGQRHGGHHAVGTKRIAEGQANTWSITVS